MILSVHIHKETGKAFVIDLENGNTWSKENLEMVINFVEEHNAHSILGDNYTAIMDAYAAIIVAEKLN